MSGKPLDTAALLADLAVYWADPEPDRITGRMPGRIAGGEWDQPVPEGTENPYWEVVRQMPLDTVGPLPFRRQRPEPNPFFRIGGGRYFAGHRELCGTYSWSICSPGDVGWMRMMLAGRGVVEPGAGGGYWAWQMRQAGVDVVAYDPNEPGEGNKFARREWATVLRYGHDAPKHHPDRALFLCWPSYSEPWAAQALACYAGDMLIYAGEGEGGCCADDEFFRLLDAEWDEAGESVRHISFWGIHCYLTAYTRKG